MQTPALCSIERNDLPSMLSTLCSYENLFGPYHPQTLHLMVGAGLAFWHYGECTYARPLLERAVRDLGRYLGREHEARLSADYRPARSSVEPRRLRARAGGSDGTVGMPKAPAWAGPSRSSSRPRRSCHNPAGDCGPRAWPRNLKRQRRRLKRPPLAECCQAKATLISVPFATGVLQTLFRE